MLTTMFITAISVFHLISNTYHLKLLNLDSSDCKCFNKKESISSFYDIGKNASTDKVWPHGYHSMYGEYLGPLRSQPVNFLEIGLGCTMHYGAGKAIPLWKEYLPFAKISILEYNRECAEQFKDQLTNLYIGDQSDFKVLEEVSKGGPYDVIVDDGGHKRSQQINSLIGLWSSVKPGGIYIMEDMFFTFMPKFMDSNESSLDFTTKLIAKLTTMKNFNLSKEQERILNSLLSINCFNKACVFIKKYS